MWHVLTTPVIHQHHAKDVFMSFIDGDWLSQLVPSSDKEGLKRGKEASLNKRGEKYSCTTCVSFHLLFTHYTYGTVTNAKVIRWNKHWNHHFQLNIQLLWWAKHWRLRYNKGTTKLFITGDQSVCVYVCARACACMPACVQVYFPVTYRKPDFVLYI